jgi:succinoglycan biosynthesis transport protein ExoP
VQQPEDSERGDLSALLSIFARRWWIIALATLATIAAAYVLSSLQDKKYTADAVLLSRPLLLDVQVTGQPLEVPGDASRDVETTARLVGQDDVLRATAARLGAPYTPKSIDDNTDIKAQGQSNLVTISATDTSAENAARLANTLAASFIALRQEVIDARLRRAIVEIRHQLAAQPRSARVSRTLLRTNLTKLALLRSVNTSDVQLADRADAPTKPSSPRLLLNLVIGAFLGLLIGVALALLAEQLDRPLRRPDELERTLGMPLLACVPRSRALRSRRKRPLGPAEIEAFRRLRAILRHRDGGSAVDSVLITPTAAASGSTTIALHLAASAAAAGLHALLIEADLRRPAVASMLALPPDSGLGAMLAAPEDALGDLPTILAPLSLDGASGDRSFEVLPAGASRSNASELLASDDMRQLVESAGARFDMVIIDGPPLSLVSDLVPLLGLVDAVVVVARMGRDTDADVRGVRTYLEQLDVRPVGAVANFCRRTPNGYPPRAA